MEPAAVPPREGAPRHRAWMAREDGGARGVQGDHAARSRASAGRRRPDVPRARPRARGAGRTESDAEGDQLAAASPAASPVANRARAQLPRDGAPRDVHAADSRAPADAGATEPPRAGGRVGVPDLQYGTDPAKPIRSTIWRRPLAP